MSAALDKWQLKTLSELLSYLDVISDAKDSSVPYSHEGVVSAIGNFCARAVDALHWITVNIDLRGQAKEEVERWLTRAHDQWMLSVAQSKRFASLTYTELVAALDFAEEVFEFIEDRFENGKRSVSHHHKVPSAPKMTLVNAGGFSKEVVKACLTTMKVAADLLKKTGNGYLLYGDIILTKTVLHEIFHGPERGESRAELLTRKKSAKQRTNRPVRVAAYYIPSSDQIVLQSKGDELERGDFMNKHFRCTLIHELGHRAEKHHRGNLDPSALRKVFDEGRRALRGSRAMSNIYAREAYQFVSPYSTTNASEMMAEAFACMHMPDEFMLPQGAYARHMAAFSRYYKPAKRLAK